MSAFAPTLVFPAILSPAFTAGMVLGLSLIMAIGPQNAHVLRMGLQRQHLWLTVAVRALADIALIRWCGLWRWARPPSGSAAG